MISWQSLYIIDSNTEALYPKNLYDIVDYFIRECVKREQRLRVWKNCGKYFVLTGCINAEYCDRPLDSAGRTCKERLAWIKYGKITKEAFTGGRKRRGKKEWRK